MKTDLYTKSVLTIIAMSLVVIAIQNTAPVAYASNSKLQKVVICDPFQDRCARVGTASQPGSEDVDVLLTINYGG